MRYVRLCRLTDFCQALENSEIVDSYPTGSIPAGPSGTVTCCMAKRARAPRDADSWGMERDEANANGNLDIRCTVFSSWIGMS